MEQVERAMMWHERGFEAAARGENYWVALITVTKRAHQTGALIEARDVSDFHDGFSDYVETNNTDNTIN